jgi:hypothetical protein
MWIHTASCGIRRPKMRLFNSIVIDVDTYRLLWYTQTAKFKPKTVHIVLFCFVVMRLFNSIVIDVET